MKRAPLRRQRHRRRSWACCSASTPTSPPCATHQHLLALGHQRLAGPTIPGDVEHDDHHLVRYTDHHGLRRTGPSSDLGPPRRRRRPLRRRRHPDREPGQDIQYQYGDIQLRVTENGSRITDVSILHENATDPRSAEINSPRPSRSLQSAGHERPVRPDHRRRLRAPPSPAQRVRPGPAVGPGPVEVSGRPAGVTADQLIRRAEPVMGTVVSFDIRLLAEAFRPHARTVPRAGRSPRRAAPRADAVFSTWKPHSPMSRLRRGWRSSSTDAPSPTCPRSWATLRGLARRLTRVDGSIRGRRRAAWIRPGW